MHALHEAIKTDTNIIGYMYWDPIFVDQKVNGAWIKTCWAEKYSGSGTTWWEDGNVISNTTLFNYQGMPLKALYEEIGSYADHGTEGIDEVNHHIVQNQKVLCNGQLLILRNGVTYTATGQER